jgi:hypothetical protein
LKRIRDTKDNVFKGVADELTYLAGRLNWLTTEIKNLELLKGKAS